MKGNGMNKIIVKENDDKRIFELYTDDDTWKVIDFKNLKEGNVFRITDMVNDEKHLLKNEAGMTMFLALSNPYINKNGIGEIRCDSMLSFSV